MYRRLIVVIEVLGNDGIIGIKKFWWMGFLNLEIVYDLGVVWVMYNDSFVMVWFCRDNVYWYIG